MGNIHHKERVVATMTVWSTLESDFLTVQLVFQLCNSEALEPNQTGLLCHWAPHPPVVQPYVHTDFIPPELPPFCCFSASSQCKPPKMVETWKGNLCERACHNRQYTVTRRDHTTLIEPIVAMASSVVMPMLGTWVSKPSGLYCAVSYPDPALIWRKGSSDTSLNPPLSLQKYWSFVTYKP